MILWMLFVAFGASSIVRALFRAVKELRARPRWITVEAQIASVRMGEKELGEGMRRRRVSTPVADCWYRLPDATEYRTAEVVLDPLPSDGPSSPPPADPSPSPQPGDRLTAYVDVDRPDRLHLTPPKPKRPTGSILWQTAMSLIVGSGLIWFALRLRDQS